MVILKKSLETINPSLAKQWHLTKNGNLTPADVTPGSGKKAWWKCDKGHEWEAEIKGRNNGRNCPYCSGRIVHESNCLATINPSLAKQWHPIKNNDLTPAEVTAGSGKKVWWKCDEEHEWQANIGSRNRGTNCPYCAGRAVDNSNSLETVNPSLAKQWHPTKNDGLDPSEVSSGSHTKVWWLCDKGHEWKASIGSRHRGNNCPYCGGKRVDKSNCLATVNPSLAKQWHPSKNNNLTRSSNARMSAMRS